QSKNAVNLNGPAVRADVLMSRFLRLRARYRKLTQYQLRPPVEDALNLNGRPGFDHCVQDPYAQVSGLVRAL
ncbi:hypothetical protein, partial [Lacticaseibacillus paracasei]|uniref:hypothetical protein n=1 Tax=Lacticaseibacillus paracasei TaxID=1597 RepID=UPI0003434B18